MTLLADADLSELFAPVPGDPRLRELVLPERLFARRPSLPRPARGRGFARETTHEGARALEPGLPAEGSIIEKYRIERLIGMGGFAVVYRVRHLILDTAVAIKLLRPSVVARRPQLPALLCEEARFAARIQHPNVVRVFDATRADELTYIAMELIDGPDLAVMLRRRGTLPPRMVLKLVRHVAAGLRAGLEQGLIHRDVKPSNILLTRAGVTKLVDFGLARSTEAAGAGQGTVGTVGYMSPEQIDHPATVDFRSDFYSLGVTAYQALTGRLPFSTADAATCTASHRTERVVPARVRNPTVRQDISDLVDWMLEKQPSRRPASHAELDRVLQDVLATTPHANGDPR